MSSEIPHSIDHVEALVTLHSNITKRPSTLRDLASAWMSIEALTIQMRTYVAQLQTMGVITSREEMETSISYIHAIGAHIKLLEKASTQPLAILDATVITKDEVAACARYLSASAITMALQLCTDDPKKRRALYETMDYVLRIAQSGSFGIDMTMATYD